MISRHHGRSVGRPWGLEINPDLNDGVRFQYGAAVVFHPTFLYESVWNVGVALLVIWLDRRWKLGHGRAFALYVAAYGLGRLWIEGLRIDDAATFLGLRLNQYTAMAAILGGLAYFWLRRRTTREQVVEPGAAAAEPRPAEDADAEPDASDRTSSP